MLRPEKGQKGQEDKLEALKHFMPTLLCYSQLNYLWWCCKIASLSIKLLEIHDFVNEPQLTKTLNPNVPYEGADATQKFRINILQ